MKLELLTTLDYPRECAMLLTRALADEGEGGFAGLERSRAEFERNHPVPPELLELYFQPLEEVSRAVMEGLTAPEERLRFYFGSKPGDPITIGTNIAGLLSNGLTPWGLSTQERHLWAVTDILSNTVELWDGDAVPADEGALIDWLEHSELGETARWSALRYYRQMETYFDEVSEILHQAEELLRRQEPLFQSLVESAAEYLRQAAENGGMEQVLRELGLQVDSKRLLVRPFLMGGTVTMLVAPGGMGGIAALEGKQDQIFFGVLTHPLRQLAEQYGATNDSLLSTLKALADPRRLEILRLLKEGPLCGQALAERLAVTPATVSHHMNTLLEEKLIALEKQGTRINYTLSEQGVERLLGELKRLLL